MWEYLQDEGLLTLAHGIVLFACLVAGVVLSLSTGGWEGIILFGIVVYSTLSALIPISRELSS